MPSFHGNTIGFGVILVTPTGDGQANDLMRTDGDGKLSFAGIDVFLPSTTKGDLLVQDANGIARLGVGADGTTPVADAAEDTGIKWLLHQTEPTDGDKGDITVAVGGMNWTINALAVTTAKINDDAVTESKIVNSAVTTFKIFPAAVTSSRIAAEAVEAHNMAADAIGTGSIIDDAVTNAKIGPLAVDTAELADLAVTNAKIGPLAVDTPELAAAAVTAAKLDDTGVTPGTYLAANIIVDAQGRITLAGSGLSLDGDNLWTGDNSYTEMIDALAGMSATAGDIHFGEIERAGTGNSQTLNLATTNHHTALISSATSTVAITLGVPRGPTAGSIIVKQGATPRNITWNSTVPIVWLGFQPTWNDAGEASSVRIVSTRYDGNALYLTATERS